MRRRILVAMVAVTAIAVVLFVIPLALALADLHREEEVVKLERAAAEAAAEIPAKFPHVAPPRELGSRPGRIIGLYDRTGQRIAGGGPLRGDQIVRTGLQGDVTDLDIAGRLVASLPVTRGEKVVGAIRVSVPQSIVTDRTRNAVLVMTALGVVAVGISALIALWQSRRLARPVDRLAITAARLGEGDFTAHAEPSGVAEVDAVSRALDQTAVRIERILTRERNFSEDASHQLRTPLTSLRVTLEAARLDPTADRERALDDAIAEVDRIERTIHDLLALAREQPTVRPVTEVDRALERLDTDWRARLQAAGRVLRVTWARGLPDVAVSDRAIGQILDVLVDNGVRHGRGAITVRARPATHGVVIEVADEGPGIEGDPERVFERRVSAAGGTGIGLALARALAEAEGGRLLLRDAGPHPTFALVLPASPPESFSVA